MQRVWGGDSGPRTYREQHVPKLMVLQLAGAQRRAREARVGISGGQLCELVQDVWAGRLGPWLCWCLCGVVSRAGVKPSCPGNSPGAPSPQSVSRAATGRN